MVQISISKIILSSELNNSKNLLSPVLMNAIREKKTHNHLNSKNLFFHLYPPEFQINSMEIGIVKINELLVATDLDRIA